MGCTGKKILWEYWRSEPCQWGQRVYIQHYVHKNIDNKQQWFIDWYRLYCSTLNIYIYYNYMVTCEESGKCHFSATTTISG